MWYVVLNLHGCVFSLHSSFLRLFTPVCLAVRASCIVMVVQNPPLFLMKIIKAHVILQNLSSAADIAS